MSDQQNDHALRGYVGYSLKRAMHIISSDLAIALKPFDLRMITFSTLAVIATKPGQRLSQLSDILAVERPNLVAIIDELEKRGLIQRERDPHDRRAISLTTTAAGQSLYTLAAAAVSEHEANLFKGLSAADLSTLTKLLKRIETSKPTE